MMNRAFEQWCNDIDKRPALAAIASILWVSLIAGVAFFWHLGSTGLIDETEPLFAEASRQMLVRGDWITPFFNDETRFDKPALVYWCQALAYSILGVNEWAVRLPSALAATAVIGLGFYTLYWYQSQKDELEGVSRPSRRWFLSGLGAALIGLNLEMIVWARAGVSDMLLTGCMVCALFCFFLGYANSQEQNSFLPSKWYLGFYILIAGAILTKGPVGIVLPGLIVGAFLIYIGKLREVMREMRLLPGIVIIIALAAPWYVLVTWRNGWNFINSFFIYHNAERFTSVVNRHSAPWFFYFLVVLLGFAPYSVYLPLAFAKLKFWQPNFWRNQPRSQQFSIFVLIWFSVIFGFFTIAVTKLPSYVLPLMPAAAILIALLWSDLIETTNIKKAPLSPPSPQLRISGWVNVILASALAVATFYVTKLIGDDNAAPNFRQLLQQAGLPVVGGIIWLICAIALGLLILQRRWLAVIGINLTAFTAFLLLVLTPALFIIDSDRQLPLRKLAAVAAQNQQPQEELIMVGFKKPTLAFYSQRTVNYIKLTEEARNYFKNRATNKLQPSVMVLSQPRKFPEMGLQSTDYKILGDSGAYQLIRVREGE
jgi:4-amino-4-deoxy-L-arabinose transferase-like glycosyltransferase